MLFDEVKEEASFRRELSDSFKQSNENFLNAMNGFNKTVSDLGSGLCKSIDMLAQAMLMSNQQAQRNQNMFFPNRNSGNVPGCSVMTNFNNNIPQLNPDSISSAVAQNSRFATPSGYRNYTEWIEGKDNE